MTGRKLTVDAYAEGAQIIVGTARGQVIHPVNLEAIRRDLGSHNRGARKRAERRLLAAVKRGVVVPVGAEQ